MGIFEKIRSERPELPKVDAIADEQVEQPLYDKTKELVSEYRALEGNTFVQIENQYVSTQSRIDNLKRVIEKSLYSDDLSNGETLQNHIEQYRRSIDRLKNLQRAFENASKTDIENLGRIEERMTEINKKLTEMEYWLQMITVQNHEAN